MSSDSGTDRRSFLKAAGGAAAAATVAGCLGGNGSGGNGSGGGNGNGNGSGGGSGGSGGTLIYARGDFPSNYDPQQSTSGEVAKVTDQVFSHLVMFVPGTGGKIKGGLAKKYELNGKTATLTLRKGVKFHNGEEFTAADFKATYRRFVDESYPYYLGKKSVSGTPSGYAPVTFSNWVKSVNTKGKYDLEIQLKQKYAPFLRNLGMFPSAVLSKKQIEKLGKNQNQLGKQPVGTGPFPFKKLDTGTQRVLLGKNDEYWGEGPYLDQVIFTAIGKNSTRAQSLISGDSHVIDGISAEASKQIQSADSTTLLQKDGLNIGYMAMNMARFKPFRKKKVRQAISYAVNTKAIVNDIYQGFASQADQPLPPTVLGYDDSINPYPTDKKKAKQLLKQAGETGFTFELATFSNPRGYNPSPVQTAQQVKSDLQDIGITANINQFSTFSSYLEYTYAGKHDACFLGWYSDNADPDNFDYVLLHPGVDKSKIPDGQDWVSFDTEGFNTNDSAAWANREFMDLVERGQATYDTAKRKSLYQKAGQVAHEEAPWVFVDYAKTLRGINEKVDKSTYKLTSINKPYLESVKLNQ
ncbi:MAG TPA: ABC transporter substrate-binding protein [Halococcus sp.]|nr:ABC transporter substrate-binding protein [Halococcus sp.]